VELPYTYWPTDDGWLVGSLDAYPGHYTQGCDIAELEEMLTDLYTIRQEEETRLVRKQKNGMLRIPA
jgi:predicted RNase H-like HicB family nuclease